MFVECVCECESASVLWCRVMGVVRIVVTHRVECKIMHNFWYRFMAYAFDASFRRANAVDWWHFCAANMPFVADGYCCVMRDSWVGRIISPHILDRLTGCSLAHAIKTWDNEKQHESYSDRISRGVSVYFSSDLQIIWKISSCSFELFRGSRFKQCAAIQSTGCFYIEAILVNVLLVKFLIHEIVVVADVV